MRNPKPTTEKPLTLFEYEHLCADPGLEGTVTLEKDAFEALELFLAALAEDTGANPEEMHEVFRLSSRRGRKTLAVQNYVGVISAAGTTIEVLPKIGKAARDDEDELSHIRTVLHAMLSELRDAPFKDLGKTGLATSDAPVLEVFISVFLDEVQRILQRGIRSDYRDWSGNERFMKGRLNFSEQMRLNHIDHSRFAVEYSVYHVNRPENRLIKSTLLHLLRQSRDTANRRRLKVALDHLAEVEPSTNERGDFAACKNDRNTAHYSNALAWCRIFLAQEAPTPFSGIVTADALLFPMERIFEDYVAAKLKRTCLPLDMIARAQDSERHLFERPLQYGLRPDIVVTNREGHSVILDTKWKLPRGGRPTQSDMYQMFAYAARYGIDHVVLVYPATGDTPSGEVGTYRTRIVDRQITVHTYFYRLPTIDRTRTVTADGAEELAHFVDYLMGGQRTTL